MKEKVIDLKMKLLQEYQIYTKNKIENKIKENLGEHWGVYKLAGGYLEIGIINTDKSTDERTEFYFAQTFTIRFEEKSYMIDQDSFESNCAAAGSFSTEGGNTIGQRAFFYVGVGKFFEDKELVQEIKQILIDFVKQWKIKIDEISKLRDEIGL